jgi:hypothetical protein
MHDGEDLPLEADARLAGAAPRRLLDVYLALRVNDDVGYRGAERRDWGLADRAVRADLEQLVAAVDDTPAQHDPDALADMVSAMNARAPDLDSAAVLGTLLDVLRARADRVPGVRTRFVGASAKGDDWEHAANVLAAWHASLAYSDGDGDETYLPSAAEALVELWSQAAAKKEPAKTVAATGPARPYDPRAGYRVGDAVAHARFGDGVVVGITDTLAVIRFASGERKLAHAPKSESHVAASVARAPAPPAHPAHPPHPAPAAVAGGVVKRLPPDPRLAEADAPEQFAHLANLPNDDGDPEP